MPKVFASLAAANLILFIGAAALGYFDSAPRHDRHVLLAVMALLLACLVQVLTFTYLTVTGKVIGQAVHLGRLSIQAVDEVKAIKKRFARRLGAIMLILVVTTATGAVAWRSGDPHSYHAPTVLVMVCAWMFLQVQQYSLVAENAGLVDRTLAEYRAAKPERPDGVAQVGEAGLGLPSTSLEKT